MQHKIPSLFPWKHNKTKVMAEPVLEEDVNLDDKLAPCAICGRTFLPGPLVKHAKICERSATKKRKIFNSLRQRVAGTDLAAFHQPSYLKKQEPIGKASAMTTTTAPSPPLKTTHASWKDKHQQLVSAIQEAKESSPESPTITPHRQRSMSVTNAGFERCPTCERQFGPKAFDRHVEWCRERQSRLTQCPASITQAKERLDARIKYRVPPMNRPKKTVKEKYQSPSKTVETVPAAKSTSSLTRRPSVRKTVERKVEKLEPIIKTTVTKKHEPLKSSGKRIPSLKINTTEVNTLSEGLTVCQLNGSPVTRQKLTTWSEVALAVDKPRLGSESSESTAKPVDRRRSSMTMSKNRRNGRQRDEPSDKALIEDQKPSENDRTDIRRQNGKPACSDDKTLMGNHREEPSSCDNETSIQHPHEKPNKDGKTNIKRQNDKPACSDDKTFIGNQCEEPSSRDNKTSIAHHHVKPSKDGKTNIRRQNDKPVCSDDKKLIGNQREEPSSRDNKTSIGHHHEKTTNNDDKTNIRIHHEKPSSDDKTYKGRHGEETSSDCNKIGHHHEEPSDCVDETFTINGVFIRKCISGNKFKMLKMDDVGKKSVLSGKMVFLAASNQDAFLKCEDDRKQPTTYENEIIVLVPRHLQRDDFEVDDSEVVDDDERKRAGVDTQDLHCIGVDVDDDQKPKNHCTKQHENFIGNHNEDPLNNDDNIGNHHKNSSPINKEEIDVDETSHHEKHTDFPDDKSVLYQNVDNTEDILLTLKVDDQNDVDDDKEPKNCKNLEANNPTLQDDIEGDKSQSHLEVEDPKVKESDYHGNATQNGAEVLCSEKQLNDIKRTLKIMQTESDQKADSSIIGRFESFCASLNIQADEEQESTEPAVDSCSENVDSNDPTFNEPEPMLTSENFDESENQSSQSNVDPNHPTLDEPLSIKPMLIVGNFGECGSNSSNSNVDDSNPSYDEPESIKPVLILDNFRELNNHSANINVDSNDSTSDEPESIKPVLIVENVRESVNKSSNFNVDSNDPTSDEPETIKPVLANLGESQSHSSNNNVNSNDATSNEPESIKPVLILENFGELKSHSSNFNVTNDPTSENPKSTKTHNSNIFEHTKDACEFFEGSSRDSKEVSFSGEEVVQTIFDNTTQFESSSDDLLPKISTSNSFNDGKFKFVNEEESKTKDRKCVETTTARNEVGTVYSVDLVPQKLIKSQQNLHNSPSDSENYDSRRCLEEYNPQDCNSSEHNFNSNPGNNNPNSCNFKSNLNSQDSISHCNYSDSRVVSCEKFNSPNNPDTHDMEDCNSQLHNLPNETSGNSSFSFDELNIDNVDRVIYQNNVDLEDVESLSGLYSNSYSSALSIARLEREVRGCCSEIVINSDLEVERSNFATYSETELSTLVKLRRFVSTSSNVEELDRDKIFELAAEEFLKTPDLMQNDAVSSNPNAELQSTTSRHLEEVSNETLSKKKSSTESVDLILPTSTKKVSQTTKNSSSSYNFEDSNKSLIQESSIQSIDSILPTSATKIPRDKTSKNSSTSCDLHEDEKCLLRKTSSTYGIRLNASNKVLDLYKKLSDGECSSKIPLSESRRSLLKREDRRSLSSSGFEDMELGKLRGDTHLKSSVTSGDLKFVQSRDDEDQGFVELREGKEQCFVESTADEEDFMDVENVGERVELREDGVFVELQEDETFVDTRKGEQREFLALRSDEDFVDLSEDEKRGFVELGEDEDREFVESRAGEEEFVELRNDGGRELVELRKDDEEFVEPREDEAQRFVELLEDANFAEFREGGSVELGVVEEFVELWDVAGQGFVKLMVGEERHLGEDEEEFVELRGDEERDFVESVDDENEYAKLRKDEEEIGESREDAEICAELRGEECAQLRDDVEEFVELRKEDEEQGFVELSEDEEEYDELGEYEEEFVESRADEEGFVELRVVEQEFEELRADEGRGFIESREDEEEYVELREDEECVGSREDEKEFVESTEDEEEFVESREDGDREFVDLKDNGQRDATNDSFHLKEDEDNLTKKNVGSCIKDEGGKKMSYTDTHEGKKKSLGPEIREYNEDEKKTLGTNMQEGNKGGQKTLVTEIYENCLQENLRKIKSKLGRHPSIGQLGPHVSSQHSENVVDIVLEESSSADSDGFARLTLADGPTKLKKRKTTQANPKRLTKARDATLPRIKLKKWNKTRAVGKTAVGKEELLVLPDIRRGNAGDGVSRRGEATVDDSETNYNPFLTAERQLMELLECDDLKSLKSPVVKTADNNPKPRSVQETNAKNLKHKRASVIDPPSDFRDMSIFEDNFELIESFINDNLGDENLLDKLDAISLKSCFSAPDANFNAFCDDLPIDPRLINEYDNLSIPEHLTVGAGSPSPPTNGRLFGNRPVSLEPIEVAESGGGDAKGRRAAGGAKKASAKSSRSSTSSSFARSPSPLEKKKNLSSLKRSISILDPVKPKNLRNREDVQNYFDEREAAKSPTWGDAKTAKAVVAKEEVGAKSVAVEDLFSVDDEMYEEYKKYEQMYLQEKEEKLRLERKAQSEDDSQATKISGDSAYGSLGRGKAKVRTKVARLLPLENRTDSASSSGSDTGTIGSSGAPSQVLRSSLKTSQSANKLSKFCHECGNKYPLHSAKFCVECGVKRLVL